MGNGSSVTRVLGIRPSSERVISHKLTRSTVIGPSEIVSFRSKISPTVLPTTIETALDASYVPAWTVSSDMDSTSTIRNATGTVDQRPPFGYHSKCP